MDPPLPAAVDVASGATRWPAVLELVASVWPRLRTAIPQAASLGARWEEMSTPLVVTRGDEVLAHAGLLPIPLVLNGREVPALGMHAVCTALAERGRGHARRAIEAALAHAASRETLVLHANDPGIYGRFGFRAVEQVAFVLDVPARPRAAPMRRLSASSPEDVALVHRAFTTRTPVSHALGVGAAAELFVLDEILGSDGFSRLWWAEDLAALVACARDDERVLQIYDIVAPELPSLADIVARVDARVDRVELMFVPDRFDVRVSTRPLHPPDVLMVRGTFVDDRPVVMPPLARC